MKRNQTQKATYCLIPFIGHSGRGKTTRKGNRSVVAGVGGGGELTTDGYKGTFLCLDYGCGRTTIRVCQNI